MVTEPRGWDLTLIALQGVRPSDPSFQKPPKLLLLWSLSKSEYSRILRTGLAGVDVPGFDVEADGGEKGVVVFLRFSIVASMFRGRSGVK